MRSIVTAVLLVLWGGGVRAADLSDPLNAAVFQSHGGTPAASLRLETPQMIIQPDAYGTNQSAFVFGAIYHLGREGGLHGALSSADSFIRGGLTLWRANTKGFVHGFAPPPSVRVWGQNFGHPATPVRNAGGPPSAYGGKMTFELHW